MTIRWLNPLSQHENVLQFSILVAKFIPTRTTTAAAILVISRVPLVWTEWRIIPYSPKALLIIKSRYGQMVFLKRYIIYVRHQAISTYRERRERSHTLLATDTWQLPAKAIRNEDIKKLPANRGWCWTFCVFLSRIFFLENWKFTLHLYSWFEYDKWQNFQAASLLSFLPRRVFWPFSTPVFIAVSIKFKEMCRYFCTKLALVIAFRVDLCSLRFFWPILWRLDFQLGNRLTTILTENHTNL